VHNNDLPNLKSNEDRKFYMKHVLCNDCEKTLGLSDIIVDYFQEHNMNLICPYCKTNNLIVLDEEKSEVNDNFYIHHLCDYNEIIYNHHDLVFNQKD